VSLGVQGEKKVEYHCSKEPLTVQMTQDTMQNCIFYTGLWFPGLKTKSVKATDYSREVVNILFISA